MSDRIYYQTSLGRCVCADSLKVLSELPNNSIDLIVTSPPFALQRKKEYGNEDQTEYVEWFLAFGRMAYPKLKETGSFVVDLGGAYQKGTPIRSLYQYRLLIRMCDELGYMLAEEFFWHNSSKLPSPIEYVNKRKIRAKDSVNTNWWFVKSPYAKADVRNVLVEYSDRMKKLLASNGTYYKAQERPSGHQMSDRFNKDNGGAIPSNLLQIPNSESNSKYLRYCKALGIKGHPARFPAGLPQFYIKMLTEPGDLVVDIFAGANTTGMVAEDLGRRWLSIELRQDYVASSVLRFADTEEQAREYYSKLMEGKSLII